VKYYSNPNTTTTSAAANLLAVLNRAFKGEL